MNSEGRSRCHEVGGTMSVTTGREAGIAMQRRPGVVRIGAAMGSSGR